MEPNISFPQQYFAASSLDVDNRILLAGGLHPVSGSRSAFQATVVCYDYARKNVLWTFEKPKSYPFRAIAQCDGVCAALLDQNFVRCPRGIFRFDVESGELLEPPCEVDGAGLNGLDALEGAFFFAWADQGVSRLRIVPARDPKFQEKSFPYHWSSDGKTIERVIAVDRDSFIAIFSLVQQDRVSYSAERWDMNSTSPKWVRSVTRKHAIRNGRGMLLWGQAGPALEIAIHSTENGGVEALFCVPLRNVLSIQPIDNNCYAVLTLSDVCILNVTSQTVTPIAGIERNDILDFGTMAIDFAAGKLIVVTAGNHQRVGTKVFVLDL